MSPSLKHPPDKLTTHQLGHSWQYFANIGSTNEWLKAERPHLPAGTVAIADHQHAGKGRLGRRWSAPPGTAVLMSILLRPHWPPEKANWLTMIAGLAATHALSRHTGSPIHLKWPNDVVWATEDTVYKMGGILLEGLFDEHGRLATGIVGMGLNVNLTATDLPPAAGPATSARLVAGQPLDRTAVVADLLNAFEAHYDAADAGQSPHTAWEKQLVTVGRAVTVTPVDGGESWTGTAVGVDEWGHLKVMEVHGRIRTISAADVTLRPPNSSDG